MKAHEFITRLDEAKYGRRMAEDKAPIAPAPSHAPTKTAQFRTASSGKSEDHGERMGGEKDAIKKSSHSIPAPVAKAPSHAPTSGTDATTKGKGSSEDHGEKVSKEAMKEALNSLMAGEDIDLDSLLGEGAHKPGCQCGFCKNKGSFGKKKETEPAEDETEDDSMQEDCGHCDTMPPAGPRIKRRIGGKERMSFRHPIRPPAKAAMNMNQPAMEQLRASRNGPRSVAEMADRLLDYPES